uniref:uncharacterized protein LOC122594843 n=1 Tax=Erigeron canadensis TaxID=72917 RepID=UPI001CB92DB7|nr:uncharacterized protein LOC122594843 [Erigeron canadensis]
MGESLTSVRIARDVLSTVESFCIDRFEIFRRCYYVTAAPHSSDILKDFDQAFVRQHSTLTKLIRLLDAALQLQIESLRDLMTAAIAKRLEKMPPKQILKKFNLPRLDLFPERELEICLACRDLSLLLSY